MKINIASNEIIHFIGIGGIGMSGMAELLVKSGYCVTGSDLKENDRTTFLSSIGCGGALLIFTNLHFKY